MKTSLKMTLGAVLWTAMVLQPSTLLAQGSLTPPGAPAPTMKTLAQIEPRTPITNATTPVTISVPGSYYLTTNLTVSGGDAITIAANGVTLDLNGFTISSITNPASGTAILLSGGLRNIAIQNGHIQGGVTNNGSGVFSGPGFGYGIFHSGSVPQNVRVSGVSVSGCRFYGIYVGDGESTLVENCVVRTVGQYGIVANTIRGCVALDCGSSALSGRQVSDSRGESVNGDGLYAANAAQNSYGRSIGWHGLSAVAALNCTGYALGSGIGLNAYTAQNCYGYSGSESGLYAVTALNCYGYSGSGTGLRADYTVIGCYGYSSSGIGLYADTAQNCYGYSSSGGTGLYANYTAIGCYGYSGSGTRGLYAQNAAFCVGTRFGGRAIEATIANGCYSTGGTNAIIYKYNMP
jgi:hypothetical protein